MAINQLKLSAFRCFEQADFQFSPEINVLSGQNGIGKTSVLESIYFLSTGKSFRSPKANHMVKNSHNGFSVYAHVSDGNATHTIGCQYNKPAKKTLKHNNQITKKQTELASVMPVLSIDPSSYLFCDNSPQFRRSFLDWMVFHVKHDYINIWSKVMRCHKHINQLLKKKQINDLPLWFDQYCTLADQLNQLRLTTFESFVSHFNQLCEQLLPELQDTQLKFHPGWSDQYPLSEVMAQDLEKNIIYGQLRHGAHRMDIQLKSQGTDIKNIYSRGQKKMVSLICYLSCLQVMDSLSDKSSILCLDDFDAELDRDNASLFFNYLKSLNNQIIISTVEASRYENKNVNMFHVEH